MNQLAPSIHTHFNARFSPIESLVEIFITSENFETVARQSHTIVLGPRGSGKTCLLKMLQPLALAQWKGSEADAIKSRIDYIGVYIPTDISWSKQAEQLGKPGLSEPFHIRLQEAAFTAQVLIRFLDTVSDCIDLRETAPWANISLDRQSESLLVEELAVHWRLDISIPTVSALRRRLAARVLDIWKFGRIETLMDEVGRTERFATNSDLNFGFVEEVSYAIELLNDFSGVKNRKWALLFDELEIAPVWLVERLFPNLRSTANQNLFFKLSLSPFTKIRQESTGASPRQGNDYELVTLSYLLKTEAIRFSKRLLKETMARACKRDVDLEKIFGPSPLKPRSGAKDSGYGPGSRAHKVLKAAVESDPGFLEYVRSRNLNLDLLHKLPEVERAAEIRKVFPLVLFRQEYLKFSDDSSEDAGKRSRKKPNIYSGLDSFLELLEGNPRWIVGAVDKLKDRVIKSGKVTASQQFDYVKSTSERFLSLLKTIPLSDLKTDTRSLGDVIDLVGDRISESVRQDDFTSEPFGSFRVDERCPRDILDSLGIAMNAGAVILQSPSETDWLTQDQLFEKEFRMSYLFSPYKRIPFRIGRSFPLSDVILFERQHRRAKRSVGKMAGDSTEELNLGL